MLQLRPYQENIIKDLRKVFLQGYKSPVIVLGCGGGKSVITAAIAKSCTDKKNYVLFVVHRIELVDQIKATFANMGVDMNYCDIAMVQSSKKYTKDYKLIITDESHHATCKTYQSLYQRYPNALRVNVTATPCRSDGKGLGDTCDYMLKTVSTKWLIENHYLSPYEYYSVTLDGINLHGLKKVRGEYEDITDLLDKPKIYGDVFKYYKPGKKVICYCSSLNHSIATAQAFCVRGIPAKHIDGNTPKEERKQIIQDFRDGKIMVLCNFSLIAEGFDVPDCDMVMILRKTASLNLFIQMSMRCMRYKPNKIAYIYDFCGNCYEHGLPDDDRDWELNSSHSHARNPSGEPNIITRTCNHCLRTYSGNSRICPYCGFDNGKTPKEIEQEKQAELEKITKIEKKQRRMEVGRTHTFEKLCEICRERKYKPGWVMAQAKLKNISIDWGLYHQLRREME